jgi:hypothetical protein
MGKFRLKLVIALNNEGYKGVFVHADWTADNFSVGNGNATTISCSGGDLMTSNSNVL